MLSDLNAQRERERAREGRTQTRKHREREREREIALSNLFLRSRTQKSSNPFVTNRCEPKNRQTHSPLIVANPEIVAPFVKPEIFPLNCRSACFGLILSPIRLLSLISDFLVVVVVVWVVLILLFSDFGLISNLMNFFLLGIENLGFDEFGFCWI